MQHKVKRLLKVLIFCFQVQILFQLKDRKRQIPESSSSSQQQPSPPPTSPETPVRQNLPEGNLREVVPAQLAVVSPPIVQERPRGKVFHLYIEYWMLISYIFIQLNHHANNAKRCFKNWWNWNGKELQKIRNLFLSTILVVKRVSFDLEVYSFLWMIVMKCRD